VVNPNPEQTEQPGQPVADEAQKPNEVLNLVTNT